MTLWLMVMFLILTPDKPPMFLVLPAKSQEGCQQRQQEFIAHLETKPFMAVGQCIYMPKYLGSI